MLDWLQSLMTEVGGDTLFSTRDGNVCVLRESDREPKEGQLIVGPSDLIELFKPSKDGERTCYKLLVAQITFLHSD